MSIPTKVGNVFILDTIINAFEDMFKCGESIIRIAVANMNIPHYEIYLENRMYQLERVPYSKVWVLYPPDHEEITLGEEDITAEELAQSYADFVYGG